MHTHLINGAWVGMYRVFGRGAYVNSMRSDLKMLLFFSSGKQIITKDVFYMESVFSRAFISS